MGSGKRRKTPYWQKQIVAAGQSAGGHLALSTAMIEDYNETSDDPDISCRPNAILLFSACVNTVEAWCDRLLADRRNKIWSISPAHNIKGGMPPMIGFHGKYDEQVPVWTVQFFESAMKKEGNYFELHEYEDRRHYLGDGNPKYSRYFDDEILEITDDFLRKYDLPINTSLILRQRQFSFISNEFYSVLVRSIPVSWSSEMDLSGIIRYLKRISTFRAQAGCLQGHLNFFMISIILDSAYFIFLGDLFWKICLTIRCVIFVRA